MNNDTEARATEPEAPIVAAYVAGQESEIERLRAAMNDALPFTVVLGQQILMDALGPNVRHKAGPAAKRQARETDD